MGLLSFTHLRPATSGWHEKRAFLVHVIEGGEAVACAHDVFQSSKMVMPGVAVPDTERLMLITSLIRPECYWAANHVN